MRGEGLEEEYFAKANPREVCRMFNVERACGYPFCEIKKRKG